MLSTRTAAATAAAIAAVTAAAVTAAAIVSAIVSDCRNAAITGPITLVDAAPRFITTC